MKMTLNKLVKKMVLVLLLNPLLAFADPSATQPATTAAPQLIPTIAHGTVLSDATNPSKTVQIQGPHARAFTDQGDIYASDSISTEAGQTVKLVFDDKSEVWVAPLSKLIVQNYSVVPQKKFGQFFLEKGLMRSLVQKDDKDKIKFHVQTSTATMGVRGTEFLTEVGADHKTSLYTLEGSVAIGHSARDLESDMSHRVVKEGLSSEMKQGQTLPTAPHKYDSKLLLARLQSISPHIATSVKEKIQARKVATSDNKAAPKKAYEPEKPKRKMKRKK